MRAWIRAAFGSVALAVFVLAPTSALAARPDHEVVSGTFSLTNFCGSGVTIDVSYKNWVRTFWEDRVHQEVSFVSTNPLNEVQVVLHWTFMGTTSVIDEAGGY